MAGNQLELFDKTIEESKKWLREQNREMSSKTYKDFKKKMGWMTSNHFPFLVWKEWYFLYKKNPTTFEYKLRKMIGTKKYLGYILFELKGRVSPKRLELFKDAFDAHYQKKYHISIPLLTTQIEGLTWELAQKRMIIQDKYNSKVFISTNQEADLYCIAKQLFGKEVNKSIFFDIFQNGFRNDVLHGRNYYRNKAKHINRKNSVKLVLAIYRIVLEF